MAVTTENQRQITIHKLFCGISHNAICLRKSTNNLLNKAFWKRVHHSGSHICVTSTRTTLTGLCGAKLQLTPTGKCDQQTGFHFTVAANKS
jgi:hypothetical protein